MGLRVLSAIADAVPVHRCSYTPAASLTNVRLNCIFSPIL
jgi:hypothetical protein